MKKIETINGQDLRDMFTTATTWLEKSVSDIDALNVFPVPDGDTGTNMLLTADMARLGTGSGREGIIDWQ